ncbi:hypothetical protein [Methylomagnum ishizawai]|uniref:hypothetical protein n=1 Tax=Methylomagnum ishizawai TaxID=1760988 RepID=UPI001C33E006|nr:hypothetical protein [Methylomagnum ishizawai]BBL75042.1 hypothetical protein MishRS11D_21400 [Methylomagnum ishizawai]
MTGSGFIFDTASSVCPYAGGAICTQETYRVVNTPYDASNPDYNPYGGPALDPSLATPLSLTDEMVGQLQSTRDFDWFYVDITDDNHPVTPVYFGCDKKLGYWYEGFDNATDPKLDDSSVFWNVAYFYDADPNTADGLTSGSSYVVYRSSCQRGSSETKGPYRFQMDTSKQGRYYVRIWGRYIGDRKETSTKKIPDPTDSTKTLSVDVFKFYNEIVVPTADYSLRLYTARVGGELEPNDGMVEAYSLTSGTTATGQLSSMYDQDWFYIDNDSTKNKTGNIPFYFNCKSQTNTYYILSSYDEKGVLQSNYEIQSSQCSAAGGFLFTIDAPVSARYYFVVTSPPSGESDSFTQADYTVLAIANNSGVSGPTVRLPGELEPNETPVNAYPLTNTVPVTAQLSSITDLDYYVYHNDTGANPNNTVPITFRCQNSGEVYTLSYFNTQGFLQQAYTVTAGECSSTDGFQFTINTPATADYYILVSGPSGGDTALFGSGDYTLTAYVNNNTGTANATGSLVKGQLVDSGKSGKDSFAFNVKGCGGNKGTVKLTGNKLNMTTPSINTQVKVEIGGWSCVSDAKNFTQTNSAPQTLVYPKPAATPAKQTNSLSGTN